MRRSTGCAPLSRRIDAPVDNLRCSVKRSAGTASACNNAVRTSSAGLRHLQERNCGPVEPTPCGRYRCRCCVLLAGGPSAAVAIADPGRGHSDNGKDSDSSGSRKGSRGGRTGATTTSTAASAAARIPTATTVRRAEWDRVARAGTSDERPSSDYSPDPPQFKTPKVTFGDGRTPGVQDHDTEPRWRWSAPEPAPPPPPEVITVPLNPPTISPVREQPGGVHQLVAPTAGMADPLWGVAGLLLIPATGAILGCRQARAAEAIAKLGRRP